jgi:hypothetical protein
MILIETIPQTYGMYSIREETNQNFLCLSVYVCLSFFLRKVLWAIIKLVFAVAGRNVSRAALLTKRLLPGFYCVCYAVLRLIVGSISRATGRWTGTRQRQAEDSVKLRMVAEKREK